MHFLTFPWRMTRGRLSASSRPPAMTTSRPFASLDQRRQRLDTLESRGPAPRRQHAVDPQLNQSFQRVQRIAHLVKRLVESHRERPGQRDKLGGPVGVDRSRRLSKRPGQRPRPRASLATSMSCRITASSIVRVNEIAGARTNQAHAPECSDSGTQARSRRRSASFRRPRGCRTARRGAPRRPPRQWPTPRRSRRSRPSRPATVVTALRLIPPSRSYSAFRPKQTSVMSSNCDRPDACSRTAARIASPTAATPCGA